MDHRPTVEGVSMLKFSLENVVSISVRFLPLEVGEVIDEMDGSKSSGLMGLISSF